MTGPVSIRCLERFASSCLDIYASHEIPALGTTILIEHLKAAPVSQIITPARYRANGG